VAARDAEKASEVADMVADTSTEVRAVPFGDGASVEADLIVNATPLGAAGETLPTPRLHAGILVVDLLYHPAVTPLLAAAREAGAAAFGGLGLLLHQAALSFELWTGQPAPLGVMSAAALAELAEQG
jgi:shikimate dehydrogenase